MTEKFEALRSYFQQRLPDCEVTAKWHVDFGWRFYFVKANKNHHILDVSCNVLDDWSTGETIARLEAARWIEILRGHPHEVARFTQDGFAFRPWPS